MRPAGCWNEPPLTKLIAFVLVLLAATAQPSGQPAIQPAAARFTDKPLTISAADCTAARLGDSIPAASIGEPVAGVALSEPRWVAAQDVLPARCEVDGRMAPVDTAATARPINFRVWLPAEWNRRAVQQGGSGNNGVVPDLRGAPYAIDGRSPAQWSWRSAPGRWGCS